MSWKGCKPSSVCPGRPGERIIYLSSRYPEPDPLARILCGPHHSSLFGLAPDEVFRAPGLTSRAVGSYPTFSPLPLPCGMGGLFSVALSVMPASRRTCPRASRRSPARAECCRVPRHRTLWSSDFPPLRSRGRATPHLSRTALTLDYRQWCRQGMLIGRST